MAAQASCFDLALEGERLCKSGDCQTGVSYFEAAIQVGTEDMKTLSAVYSQLGNAYFFLQEYEKALEFHRHDLTLTRTLADREGEAKASGNLGNTLKVLGKFDEAVVCCMRHLELSKESNNKVSMCVLSIYVWKAFLPYSSQSRCSYLGYNCLQVDPLKFPLQIKILISLGNFN